mmetsp:Transcript_29050/g.67960  ORF Transcript_29050/g.67960 Transcript_29050/m.67960 type:complete len:210 (-) Transcript_29050:32-661(-)
MRVILSLSPNPLREMTSHASACASPRQASTRNVQPRLIAICMRATGGRETRKRKGRSMPALAAFWRNTVSFSSSFCSWVSVRGAVMVACFFFSTFLKFLRKQMLHVLKLSFLMVAERTGCPHFSQASDIPLQLQQTHVTDLPTTNICTSSKHHWQEASRLPFAASLYIDVSDPPNTRSCICLFEQHAAHDILPRRSPSLCVRPSLSNHT